MVIGPQSQMEWGDSQAALEYWGDHAFSHATYERLVTSVLPVVDLNDQAALGEFVRLMQWGQTKESERPLTIALEAWLQAHNALHVAELYGMGLNASFDLSTVDFSDPQAFADWMSAHQDLHSAENQKVGI